MSRHRNLIQAEDFDDYDYDDFDYDDYYEEDHGYSEAARRTSHHYVSSADARDQGKESISEPPLDFIEFVLSALGDSKVSPTRAEVLAKLEESHYDTERTIDFFLSQRSDIEPKSKKVEGAKVKAVGASKLKGKPNAPPSNKNSKAASQPSKPQGGISVLKKPAQSKSVDKIESQLTSDLQLMGFTEQAEVASTHISVEDVADSISDDDVDLNFNMDSLSPHLSLIVAGHVDSGKSTLIGHLLYKTGAVSQRTVHKYERESQASGKGSFFLAWIMDEGESEREHGVTIELAQRNFSTATKRFTILDSPGHKDFMPNMVSGSSFADVAMLVVPASTGEFESSMLEGAQTREHALILKSCGVNQILVAVNKMDLISPPWNQERFTYIQDRVTALLVGLNFAVKAIRFVPVSGLTGQNIINVSEEVASSLNWYSGGTLVHALDEFKVPPRAIDRPLRALVTDVISSDEKGVEVGVKVVQGRIRIKRNISLVGSGIMEVKSISGFTGSSTGLFAGEQGTVLLVARRGKVASIFASRGMVLCKGNPLLRTVLSFKANILTNANLELPIIPGSSFEIYLHGEEMQCKVSKIYSTTSKDAAGKAVNLPRPKCIGAGRQAVVKIETFRPVCIEPFGNCRHLGRFALRNRGKTCAVGVTISF